jgi:hypothetical protein
MTSSPNTLHHVRGSTMGLDSRKRLVQLACENIINVVDMQKTQELKGVFKGFLRKGDSLLTTIRPL